MSRLHRPLIYFQRQPPGTAITRGLLVAGGIVAVGASLAIVDARLELGAGLSAISASALLLGGHRANHGAGGPTDRVLDELLDRLWDSAVLGGIAWYAHASSTAVAGAALVALSVSFLSSYVRARGASLAYSVEESHVTRGIRYALVAGSLALGLAVWALWVAALVMALAALVRTAQVAGEERRS